MEIERFKAAWQTQPLEGTATRRMEDVMAAIKNRAERLDRQVRRRDMLETMAGGVSFAFLVWTGTTSGALLARTGAALGCVALLLVAVRLHATRRRHPLVPDATSVEFTRAAIARIDDQVELLTHVTWWYTLPLLGSALLVVVGLAGFGWFTAVYCVVICALGVFIQRINRHAAERHLIPMRAALARTLENLSPDPPPTPSRP